MIGGILFKISVLSGHPVYGDNDLHPPECSLTARIEHCALSSRSHNDYRLDTLIVQNLFQIGFKKLIRRRFDYRFSLEGS